MKNEKKKLNLILSITALMLAVTLCGASLAWFFVSYRVTASPLDMVVVDKAFVMGDFKVIADDANTEVNEFSGLLPGSKFRFELLVQRKIEGDLNLKLEIRGIRGDDFIGKSDGLTHNMTELFTVAPIDDNNQPIGDEIYFDTATDGTLLLFRSVSMPKEMSELVLKFRIFFNAEKVGMHNLSNEINRKKFKIGSMFVSTI